MEIITTSANKVMLNVIGIPYTASLINAPNIYAERALAISLTVFVLLFCAVTAFIAVLIFVPKFRNLVFGNRFIKKADERRSLKKSRKKSVKENNAEHEQPAEDKPKAKTAKEKSPAKSAEEKTEKPAPARKKTPKSDK